MTVRIEYGGDRPSTQQILSSLNSQYPDRIFTEGPAGTIVESERPDAQRRPLADLLRRQEEVGVQGLKLGYGAVEAATSSY